MPTTPGITRRSPIQVFEQVLEVSILLYPRNFTNFRNRRFSQNSKFCMIGIEMATWIKMIYRATKRGEPLKQSPGYDDYWVLFQKMADANQDGLISREEWVAIWTHIANSASNISFNNLPQWVRLMPPVVFSIMDYKGDGQIDGEEFRNFWYELGGIETDIKAVECCIDEMTEDGKHILDLERFQELYADFYLSTDHTTPGKYMCGPVDYNQ